MTIQSPINEMFGCELEYIQRGLSQLDLILNCKDKRISELEQQLTATLKENAKLQKEILLLRKIMIQQSEEQVETNKFFESL